MNIVTLELKSSWKSLILWSFGVLILVIGGLSKYEAYATVGDETIQQVLDLLPKELMNLFGGATADLTKMITFFSILFLYLAVLAAVHAALLGSRILTKEESDKTTEFLMVKPISRRRVITAKLTASLVNVTILNLIISIISVFFANFYNKGESVTNEVLLMMVGMYFIQLIFLSAGMAAAATIQKPKFVAPVVTAFILGTFMLSIFLDISGRFESLKYLTPFKYFDAKVISADKALDPLFIIMSLVIVGVLVGVTYVRYGRRDLEV